jgi:hypothetical protein
MLHIVIRPRKRPYVKYRNEWQDDHRIQSITSYAAVAARCLAEQEAGRPVRIHRMSTPEESELICCEGYVESVTESGDGLYVVRFSRVDRLEVMPYATRPTNRFYYYAEASSNAGTSKSVADGPRSVFVAGYGLSQRELMRRCAAANGYHMNRTSAAYAMAEQMEMVKRASNQYGLTASQYAVRLWNDGIKKGWLRPGK